MLVAKRYSYVVILLSLFLFTSCEKDIFEQELSPHQGHEHVSPYQKSLEFFKQQSGVSDVNTFYKESIIAGSLRKSSSTPTGTIDLSNFTINTDHILMKIHSDSTTQVFSFNLESYVYTTDDTEYYNLVIAVDDRAQLQYQLYHLVRDSTMTNDLYFSSITKIDVDGTIYSNIFNKSGFRKVCSDTYAFHCPAPGNCDPDGGCDFCNRCVSVSVSCEYIYISSPATPVDEVFTNEFAVNRARGGSSGDDEDDDMEEDITCKKIGDKFKRTDYMRGVTFLKGKVAANREYGFEEDTSATFTNLPVLSNNSLDWTPSATSRGVTHTHTDDVVTTTTLPDGRIKTTTEIKIRIQSPDDIGKLFEQLRILQSQQVPLSDAYITVISSTGNWEIRVDDDFNIPTEAEFDPQNLELKNNYIEKMSKNLKNLNKGFLSFLKENNLHSSSGIKLYKVKNDGTIEEHKLDQNNNVIIEKCYDV